MRLLLMLLLLITNASYAAISCQFDGATVALHYSVTHTDNDGRILKQKPIVLWRQGEQVAIQYPETEITELWEQTKQQKLRLVRYFNHYQRGIEYQPSEINHGQGEEDWSLKRQLISDTLLEKLHLVTSDKNTDCGELQTLHSDEIELTWMADQEVMDSMVIRQPKQNITWQLQKTTTEKTEVASFFETLLSYQTTDYTDIGDNETDPFLTKMINLGFVEHEHTSPSNHSH